MRGEPQLPKPNQYESNRSPEKLYLTTLANLKIPINIKHNHRSVEAILDTGSNHTIIKRELLEERVELRETNIALAGAGDEPLNVEGIANINIEVQGKKIEIEAYVVTNICTDIILGVDFMIKHAVDINFKTAKITLESDITININQQWLRQVNNM